MPFGAKHSKFQFQKVRLVDNKNSNRQATDLFISIPKGAIGSCDESGYTPSFLSFQFQKVRLVDYYAIAVTTDDTNFNSKRCDW